MSAARTEQEQWEDEELLPGMTANARRWFLAERARRKKNQERSSSMSNTGLEYLGSVNLARIFENPESIVARGKDAAYDVNRLWFTPGLPDGSPMMVTVIPNDRERLLQAMAEHGPSEVVDFDLKGPLGASAPWYVLAVEKTDFGASVSVYIPEEAEPHAVAAVKAAWGALS